MSQATSRATFTPIITAFGSLIKKYNMYPPGHAFVEQGLNQVMSSFEKYFETYSTLAIAIGPERMYVEEHEMGDDEMLGSFVRVLHQFGVTQIKFQRGLTRADLAGFFETFAIDSGAASEAGGYREMLAAKGVTTIEISVINYQLREEHLDDVETATDAEIWQKLANAWQGQEAASEEDQAFAASLLNNVTRMAHALNSALSAKGKSGDAGAFADTFLNMINSITPDAAQTDAATMTSFRKQLQRVVEAANPRTLHFLMHKIVLVAETVAARGGPVLPQVIAGMPERKLTAGLLGGFDPQAGTVGDLVRIYQEFVADDRETAILGQIRDLVFDSDCRHDAMLNAVSSELAQLACYGPKIERLQQALAAALAEFSCQEAELYTFVEANRRDDADLLGNFSALRIEEAYCRNLLLVLEMAQRSEAGCFYGENLDTMIADMVRSGQFELADSMTQTLARHASPANENAGSRNAAQKVLKSLEREDLAEALLRAEPTWNRPDKSPLVRLLQRTGPAAFEPIMRALEKEESRSSRSFLISLLRDAGNDAVEIIKARLQHPDWRMVRNMLGLLIRLQPDDLMASLEFAAGHADAPVRKEAVKALMPAAGTRVIPLLANLIHDADEGVRRQAILNLGQFRAAAEAADLLIAALQPRQQRFHGDAKSEELALRALGGMKLPRAVDTFAPYIAGVRFYHQPNKEVVAAAAKSLWSLDVPQGRAVLEKGAKSWNRTVKQICQQCLAEPPPRTAAKPAGAPREEAPR